MNIEIKLVRKLQNGKFTFEVYKNGHLVSPERYAQLSCDLTGATSCEHNGVFTSGKRVYFKYKEIGEYIEFPSELDFFEEDCDMLANKIQNRIQMVKNWIATLADFVDEKIFTVPIP